MSAAPPFSDRENNPKTSSRIWLHEVDPDGRPVDPRFIEAGYGKEQEFFRYRADKLKDEAVIANLVEEAVYRASRAKKREPVSDIGGYLFRVFANLADREIARSPRIVSCDPVLAGDLRRSSSQAGKQIIDRVQVREIFEAMEPALRWAVERYTLGYGLQEIANEMDVSADCLSKRIRRGLKYTLKRLLGDDNL